MRLKLFWGHSLSTEKLMFEKYINNPYNFLYMNYTEGIMFAIIRNNVYEYIKWTYFYSKCFFETCKSLWYLIRKAAWLIGKLVSNQWFLRKLIRMTNYFGIEAKKLTRHTNKTEKISSKFLPKLFLTFASMLQLI